ncbi:MAG TPA: hypothetical protein PLP33_14735 [Leptospiraceae bacterium]|nr:hypothetical protein [Leptospiraceae bacterium]
MLNNEAYDSFLSYTFDKVSKYLKGKDIHEISCICGVDYDTIDMFFSFPNYLSLNSLVVINENLDKYLSDKGK